MDEFTGIYCVGSKPHQVLNTAAEFVTDILKKKNFIDIEVKMCIRSNEDKIKHAHATELVGF